MRAFTSERAMSFDELAATLGVAGGAVRASVGVATNFTDTFAFLEFVRSFLDTSPDERNLPARQHC